jgi:sugar phosphate isomerase/epimerase
MRTALHTISYSGSWGQASLRLEDIIRRAAGLGFDDIMLAGKRPHASLLDMAPAARQRLRETMQSAGVGLACIAAYTNFTADAEHSEVPHREMQIHYVTDLCRLAVELGGRIVRIFSAYEHPVLSYSRAWDLSVAAVRECARRASDAGAIIALQNHHDLAAHSESFLQFLQAVDEPACRAAFDAWAPALHGDDYLTAARKLAPLTVHTTVADYVRLPRFRYQPELINYRRDEDFIQAVPLGEGFIDYRSFLTTLRRNGFCGCVAYEMCSPLRDGNSLDVLDRYARQFVDFMKRDFER